MRNGLTRSTGAHIVMEDSSEMPNIIADGISAATGRETSISLKLINVTRLEAPYGSRCVDDIRNDSIRELYDNRFKYSAKTCNAFCYVVNTRNRCDCYNPKEVGGIMIEHYDHLSSIMTRCDETNVEQQTCLNDVHQNFSSCDCHPECHEKLYMVQKLNIYRSYNQLIWKIFIDITQLFDNVLISLLQKEISNKQWPHDGLWPILIDQMKVTYKSIKFDTEQYYKALVTGSDSHHSKTGDSVRQMAGTLRDYASGNFMRVFWIDVIWYFPML